MSRTIDERVVEMRFDNKQFEAGAKQTMGTLDRLKEALKFNDVSKSFDSLQKAANNVDMDGLGDVVDGVKLKFSALEVAAITAMTNIVNRAVNAGVQLAKSLSIDQVMSGYREYELKMASIQTIMASTGESLETVNRYLQELNEYSDKTIYSFSDMTQNIGKFTNAGVKLEDSVKAIQGISNLAAVSGANAEQASHAMYNFAQALSSGSVRLNDWRSIETANMSTVEFRQSLIDTAVAMGTVVKVGDKYRSTTTDLNGSVSELFGNTEMFNMSLSSQWLTTDVLVQTLNNYSTDIRNMTDAEKAAYEERLRGIGYTEDQIKAIEELSIKAFNSAQDIKTFSQLIDTMKESVGSGWAQTFELIFGDFEEAKQLWTNVNNVLGSIIQASANSRNELLRQWKNAGGRTDLLDAIANSFNALLSIINVVRQAFIDVFPEVTGEQLAKITANLKNFTANMKLSEEGSKNLHDAFEGIFSVISLLLDGFKSLIGAIIPVNKPILEMGGGILDLAGSMGRLLTSFTKFIRSSSIINKTFNAFSSGFSIITGGLSKFISTIRDFFKSVSKLEGTKKLIDAIRNAFVKLGNKVSPSIDKLINGIGELFQSIFNLKGANLEYILDSISKSFTNLAYGIENFNLKNIGKMFDTFKQKVKDFLDLFMANEGFATFVNNAKEYGAELEEAFTLNNLLDRIEKVMDIFGRFFNWIKNTLKPAFEDFSIGGAVATGGGIGIIYAMIKAANSLGSVAGSIKAIPDILGSVKDTLSAYQKQLKADALLKIAGAIAILAGALVILSFADTDRLFEAAASLALVGGVLMLAATGLLDAINKGKEATKALETLSKGLSSTMKKLGRAVEIKAIGSSIKDFAESIAIIAVSIIALGIMWKKDSAAFEAGIYAVGGIAGALVGIGAAMVLVAALLNPEQIKQVQSIGKSMLAVSASLAIIVFAISELMKMELPDDWGWKVGILAGIFVAFAGLILVLTKSGKKLGENQIPNIAKSMISLAVLLGVTVLALKALFNIDLPDDWGWKVGILAGIFVAFAGLIVAMGGAARLSKGEGFKAASTILAMTVFLVAVVGALFVLTLIPVKKMLTGAVSLGIVIGTLAAALAATSKKTDKNAYKTVLAMAIAIGAITAALAVLSMIPWNKLLVSAGLLSLVLLAFAQTFESLSKVKSKKALPAVLAMIAATIVIAGSLYVLSKQPWDGLLSAAGAMSAVLLAFSKSFEMILSKTWSENNVKKIGTFLLMTLAVIPIGLALWGLAKQPWEGLLTAAGALSVTILAFAEAFDMILAKNWSKNNVKKIGTFLLMTLAVIPIGLALWGLAKQPWEGLLASAVALSAVLAVLTGCFIIISKVKVDPMAIASILTGSIALALIAASIAIVATYGGDKILDSCLALSAMLLVLTGVMAACGALSMIIGPAIIGLLGLAAAIGVLGIVLTIIGGLAQIPGLIGLIEDGGKLLQAIGTAIGQFIGGIVGGIMGGISAQLPQIGLDLSQFMVNLTPFLLGAKLIDANTLASVGFLAAIIVALTVAEVINGIASLFGLSLVDMAIELSAFMVALTPFITGSRMLTEDSMKACGYLADMLIKLTAAEIISGIGRIFGLSGSLADFGAQLVAFGPSIKEFAEQVKDVKPEAVQGAAAAAQIMSDLANNLPNSGGLAAKILGDNKLSDFGAELVAFGPDIKEFADTVKDVKAESVEGAASAAQIMSDLADTLPNTGGLVSWFTGNNDIADFGEQLVSFGPNIAAFAESVKDIDAGVVTNSANAAGMLVDLADTLPNTGGLVSWFTGDNDIGDFGESLASFGNSMHNYYLSVAGIDIAQLDNIITEVKKLIDLASGAANIDTSSLTYFSADLELMAQNGLGAFIEAFTNTEESVTTAVQTMLNYVIAEFKNHDPIFGQQGSELIGFWLAGIADQNDEALTTGQELSNNALRGCNLVISAFRNAGVNAGQGFINGLKSKINDAFLAGSELGRAAYNGAREALDEHSPSKKMGMVGDYAGLGFVQSLLAYVAKSSEAGEKIGKAAIGGTISVISKMGELDDFNPTIRPNVDLENVKRSVSDINRMFNESVSYTANLARSTSSSINAQKQETINESKVSDQNASNKGNTYNFIQNNNSPKALSRIEIYRQTKNQFSQFKEATSKV